MSCKYDCEHCPYPDDCANDGPPTRAERAAAGDGPGDPGGTRRSAHSEAAYQ